MNSVWITGANRGIGLELCRQYSARGCSVTGLCRNSSGRLEHLDGSVRAGIDVTDEAALVELAAEVPDASIDILINNAGILSRDSLDDFDIADILRQFDTNALGPLRVTRTLRSKLRHGAKVIIITSRMGSISDNTSGGYYGYRLSKAAVNMAGASLARDLHDRAVAVALLHPGMVATQMTGTQGISPAQAARGLIARIDELTLDTSGGFWHANGERLSW